MQFFVPGDFGHFHHLKATGTQFDIRGGWGGAITMTSDNTVRVGLHCAVDFDIWAGRRIDAGSSVSAPVVAASEFGGDPKFQWVGMATANAHYAYFGTSGRINRANVYNSSREFKHTIEPLDITPKQVLALEPKSFYYNEDKAKELGHSKQSGFIAEEAAELGLDYWVAYSENKETGEVVPTGFNYPHFTIAQQVVLRDHESRIKELEAQIAELVKLVKSAS